MELYKNIIDLLAIVAIPLGLIATLYGIIHSAKKKPAIMIIALLSILYIIFAKKLIEVTLKNWCTIYITIICITIPLGLLVLFANRHNRNRGKTVRDINAGFMLGIITPAYILVTNLLHRTYCFFDSESINYTNYLIVHKINNESYAFLLEHSKLSVLYSIRFFEMIISCLIALCSCYYLYMINAVDELTSQSICRCKRIVVICSILIIFTPFWPSILETIFSWF